MKLLVRDPDGTSRFVDLPGVQPGQAPSESERHYERDLQFTKAVGAEKTVELPPTGSRTALDVYKKCNPVSAALFEIAECVHTKQGLVWVLSDGAVVESAVDDNARLE